MSVPVYVRPETMQVTILKSKPYKISGNYKIQLIERRNNMIGIHSRIGAACLVLGLLISAAACANELTDMQYRATEAQKKYDLEKARYDDAMALVYEQERRVAEDQELLKDRQKKLAAAKASLAKAKTQLDAENRQLQNAWAKGNH